MRRQRSPGHHGMWTTMEIARGLGVGDSTVRGWCRRGKLPCVRTPGGKRLIGEADLVVFLSRLGASWPWFLARHGVVAS